MGRDKQGDWRFAKLEASGARSALIVLAPVAFVDTLTGGCI
jgi:hypothetical protein